MPTIEIEVSERIQRHLAAVRVMSCMVFPDDPEKRATSEITFRTILADWYAGAFAKLETKVQKQFVRRFWSGVWKSFAKTLENIPAH